MKKLFNKIPLNMKLTLACILVVLIISLLYYPLIPILLNYPPDSINTSFQIEVNYFYYTTQYLAIVGLIVLALLIAFPIIFRKMNKIEKMNELAIKNNSNEFVHIIKSCFNFPIFMLLAFLIVPPLIIFVGLLALKQEIIFSLKITFILFSMCILLGLFVYTFTRILFENVLKRMKLTSSTYGIRLNLRNKILFQLLPLLLFTIVFTFLIFYSQFTKTQGDYLFDSYKQNLTQAFENKEITSVEQAKEILKSIPLKNSADSIFILDTNGNTYYSDNELSDFFKTYIFDFEEKYNGHTYEYYGNPIQGAFIRENIDGQDYILGIRYSVFTNDTITAIIPLFFIVVFINLFFIFLVAITYGNDLKVIATNLSNISKNSSESISSKLPVYSNDEIGDMTIAFNRIQDMTNDLV